MQSCITVVCQRDIEICLGSVTSPRCRKELALKQSIKTIEKTPQRNDKVLKEIRNKKYNQSESASNSVEIETALCTESIAPISIRSAEPELETPEPAEPLSFCSAATNLE